MKLVSIEIIICNMRRKIFNERKKNIVKNGGKLKGGHIVHHAHTDNNLFCLNPMFGFGLGHFFLHGKKHRECKYTIRYFHMDSGLNRKNECVHK